MAHGGAAVFASALSMSLFLAVTVTGKRFPRVKRSDDVSLPGALESLLQQQATLIQTLQSQLTAAESRLTALESNDDQPPSSKPDHCEKTPKAYQPLLLNVASAWSHDPLTKEQLVEELEKLASKIGQQARERDHHAEEIDRLGTVLGQKMAEGFEKVGEVLGRKLVEGFGQLGQKLTEVVEKQGEIVGRKIVNGFQDVAEQVSVSADTPNNLFEDTLDDVKCQPACRNTSVAFSARFADDNRDNGIAIGHHSVLRFDHVITNIGNGYNPQAGIFTAPVAGVYVFFLSFMSVYNQGHVMLVIDKHGEELDTAFANDKTLYDQGSTEVTTHLAAGEKLWVRQKRGTAVRGGTWTIFTGYLIHED